MAAWIDENVYSTENIDEQKLYQYLYHLINMQAHQVSLFKQIEKYEDFSLYAASRLFTRLTNKKQFEYDDEGNPKVKQIKSILNYIKSTIQFLRADFEIEYNGYDKVETIQIGSADISTYLVEEASHFDRYGYDTGVYELCTSVSRQLSKIPTKKKSPEWMNIFISCVLTFLDSISVENISIDELSTLYNHNLTGFRQLFEKLRNKDPILYHIDDNMKNYIKVLVQEIKHAITAELRYESDLQVSVDTMVKQLMIDALNNEDEE